MKKFFCFISSFVIMITIACVNSSAFATEPETTDKIYKIEPIIDKRTKTELARTLIPTDFTASSGSVWSRDFEFPVFFHTATLSPDKKTVFFYGSPRSYTEILNMDIPDSERDVSLKVLTKKFITPEDYIFETVSASNPGATAIKLIKDEKYPKELYDCLLKQIYDKTEDLQSRAKSHKFSQRIKVFNPYIKPCMQTYSFTLDGTEYKETIITMISSVDIEYKYKQSLYNDGYVSKKFWTIHGLFAFKSPKTTYDKYFDDFIIFVANTVHNTCATEAVYHTKKQMEIELNPAFIEQNTLRTKKELPSELFIKYYDSQIPDYSEPVPAQYPVMNDIRWQINFIKPLTSYSYRRLKNLFSQKIYVPSDVQNVFLNKKTNQLILSNSTTTKKRPWQKLSKPENKQEENK